MTNPLDEAWVSINALGGCPANEREVGYNEALGEALAIIEDLGGSDPLQKQRPTIATETGADCVLVPRETLRRLWIRARDLMTTVEELSE